MPARPPTACRKPGCAGLVRAGVCSVCGPLPKPDGWTDYHRQRNQTSRQSRGYGANWERLRKRVLAAGALCRMCGHPATQVDHIIPKARGGTDAESNLQPLCADCHAQKTATEAHA